MISQLRQEGMRATGQGQITSVLRERGMGPLGDSLKKKTAKSVVYSFVACPLKFPDSNRCVLSLDTLCSLVLEKY